MSIFGEALPHEDDTATSLIRREGYPPVGSYDQMPQVYACPCCSGINPGHERDPLLHLVKEEKSLERRRLMQLDIFDERAKPINSVAHRPRHSTVHRGFNDELLNQPTVPLPPLTLDELRKLRREENRTRLIVTVHYGKGINAHPRDPTSVLVRCGAFEGQTAKVPRGKGNTCTWGELFEFPYPNEEEPLEVLVIDDALPDEQDHILGGVVVPAYALRNRSRGDEEVLPICSESEMHRCYGRMKETPMGSIIVSWYVKYDDQEPEPTDGKQNLETPLNCVFVVHRVFQYTDSGAEPFTDGVLCVLRDTDDNCSESTVYKHSGLDAMSTSPYYDKEGCNYLPEPSSQIIQFITEKRLGHVLVCVSRKDAVGDEDDELLVVGAVPLEFDKIYHKGSAVLLVESKVKEDVLWGELALEWYTIPHSEVVNSLEEVKAAAMRLAEREALMRTGAGESESLFVTVARGLNLKNRDGTPLAQAQVSVFAGDMEGATVVAPNELDEDGTSNVVTWNQEVHFIEVDGGLTAISVQVLDDNQTVSTGRFELEDNDGCVVVKMHDPYDEDVDLGDIVVNYRRVCATNDTAPIFIQETKKEDVPLSGQENHVSDRRDDYHGEDEGKADFEHELEEEVEEDHYKGRGLDFTDKSQQVSPHETRSKQPGSERNYSEEVSPQETRSKQPGSERNYTEEVSPQETRSKQPGSERNYTEEVSPQETRSKQPGSKRNYTEEVSPQETRSKQPGSERKSPKTSPTETKHSKQPEPEKNFTEEVYPEETQSKQPEPEKNYTEKVAPQETRSKQPGSERNYTEKVYPEETQSKQPEPEKNYTEKVAPQETRSKQPGSERNYTEKVYPEETQSRQPEPEKNYTEEVAPEETQSKQPEPERKSSKTSPKETKHSKQPEPERKSPKTSPKETKQPKQPGSERKSPKTFPTETKHSKQPEPEKNYTEKVAPQETRSKQPGSERNYTEKVYPEETQSKQPEPEKNYTEEVYPEETQSKQSEPEKNYTEEVYPEETQSKQPEPERNYTEEVSPQETRSKQPEPERNYTEEVYPEESQSRQPEPEHEGVVGRKSEKLDARSYQQPRVELGDRPQLSSGHLDTEGNKPGNQRGEQEEGTQGLFKAGDSKPPRAVGSGQRGEPKKGSQGTSPVGVSATSPVQRSRSNALSERSQGDYSQGRHGRLTHSGDDESRADQVLRQEIPVARQPWFPARSTGTEDHIPLKKRGSFINRTDSLRALERRSRESAQGGATYASHGSQREL